MFSKIGFWAGIMVMAALVWGNSLLALHPPTPEQIEQYRQDGTLEARIRMAEELGNNKADPIVVYDTQTRLMDLYERSTGKRLNITRQPPPARQGGLPTKGTVRIPILLLDFKDYTATSTGITGQNVWNKVFGAGDPSEFPYESVKNYYLRSSYNQLNIIGNVLGWYTWPSPRPQTPDNNTLQGLTDQYNIRENMIMALLNTCANQGHNFSQYDNDNDGVIDTVVILWTGPDNGWANFWWAYQAPFLTQGYTISGKKLKKYIWMWVKNETQGDTTDVPVKTLIHEIGHVLGLPDYYDYDEKTGSGGGVGGLDMMAGAFGDHNCFSKFMLDWITPQIISSGTQSVVLNPSGTYQYGSSALAFPNAVNQIFSEYFMVQNRYRVGNDTSKLLTDGLLIWHVDANTVSDSNGLIDFKYNNSFTTHKLLRLMEADGKEAIGKNRPANSGDYYVADDEFGPGTQPDSKNYDGEDSGVYVRNIVVNSDNTIKADIGIVSALNYFTVPAPTDTWYHQDINKIVTWTTTGIAGATVNIALYRDGTFVSTIASNVPNNGTYTIPLIADTLTPAKDYRIRIVAGSVIGISGELTISAANGITVIEPNGGERIRTAAKYMIRWSKGLFSDNAVKIELMKNGEVRSVISAYTENDGSFEWNVLRDADKTPSRYYVRITSVSNPTVYDDSDDTFILSFGDINNDGKIDLYDAIAVLRILAGINPSSVTNPNNIFIADVNLDGKVGFEELIFILQKVAGLR